MGERLQIDDNFGDHAKFDAAILIGGDKAAVVWLKAACHCRRHRTGGFVATTTAVALAPGKVGERAIEGLVESGLWDVVEGGYLFHDFLVYNPTEDAKAPLVLQPDPCRESGNVASAAGVPEEDKRKRTDRERQARYRKNKAVHPDGGHVTQNVTPASVTETSSSRSVTRDSHGRSVTESVTSTVTERDIVTVVTPPSPGSPSPSGEEKAEHTQKAVCEKEEEGCGSSARESVTSTVTRRDSRDVAPVSRNAGGASGSMSRQPVTPQTSAVAAPVPLTAEGEAILARLRSHTCLRAIATHRRAEHLFGRMMLSGKKLEWVLAAIDDVARDASSAEVGGTPMGAEELGRMVTKFCDRAQPPRDCGNGRSSSGQGGFRASDQGLPANHPSRRTHKPPPAVEEDRSVSFSVAAAHLAAEAAKGAS